MSAVYVMRAIDARAPMVHPSSVTARRPIRAAPAHAGGSSMKLTVVLATLALLIAPHACRAAELASTPRRDLASEVRDSERAFAKTMADLIEISVVNYRFTFLVSFFGPQIRLPRFKTSLPLEGLGAL
jgi:hypothetical protein